MQTIEEIERCAYIEDNQAVLRAIAAAESKTDDLCAESADEEYFYGVRDALREVEKAIDQEQAIEYVRSLLP